MRPADKKDIRSLGEFGMIAMVRKTVLRTAAKVGIGDDTAVLPCAGKDKLLLVTADMLVEGIHFKKRTPARAVGHKALACSISDVAAMGGIPGSAVVSLGLPSRTPVRFVKDFYKGMAALARRFGVEIVGGDTVRSNKVIVNVTLTGWVSPKELVLRSGAHRGDFIFVTGKLGGSLKRGRHLRFTPRLAPSRYLVKHCKPTAMIDISDGLLADLTHILEASGCGAVLFEDLIPRYPGVTVDSALGDGEDFELLLTVAPVAARRLLAARRRPFPFYCIGQITGRRGAPVVIDSQGHIKRIRRRGYRHF